MYVYIFEDGTVQKHPKPPTAVDLQMIGDGTLQVLRCTHPKNVDEYGSCSDLEDCQLVDIEGQPAHSQT